MNRTLGIERGHAVRMAMPPLRHARLEDAGKLVLRFTVGGLMLFHGAAKLVTGIEMIKSMVVNAGLPQALAYGVYAGEVIGPIMLLLGLRTRIGAALVAIDMLVAIALVHANDIAALNPRSGGWAIEIEALYLFAAVALCLMGGGRYALGNKR